MPIRLATAGQTTSKGKPILDDMTGEQFRLTTGEALGKALGFQSVRSTKGYDEYVKKGRADDITKAKRYEIGDLIIAQKKGENPNGRKQALDEIRKWNDKVKANGCGTTVLTWPDLPCLWPLFRYSSVAAQASKAFETSCPATFTRFPELGSKILSDNSFTILQQILDIKKGHLRWMTLVAFVISNWQNYASISA